MGQLTLFDPEPYVYYVSCGPPGLYHPWWCLCTLWVFCHHLKEFDG